jgi:bacillithiol biosynthesis deacetylase BshB1
MIQHDILALAAHPDDTELSCSGTLAKLAQQGHSVAVADLTMGEMGSRGTPHLRLEEAQNAAEILGISRYNLGLPDTLLENSRALQLEIIKAIRAIKPNICFINAPNDRHPDHGNAHKLSIDALFYAGLVKIETQINGENQLPHRPQHIFYYMQDTPFEPDIVFDISDTMHLKERSILAFESQFNVDDAADGPKTYISDKKFFEMIKSRARIYGQLIGVQFGEPFKYHGGPIPMADFKTFFDNQRLR